MRFLMIALAYSVPTGVVAGWSGVLDMILTPVRVSQVGYRLTTHEEHTSGLFQMNGTNPNN